MKVRRALPVGLAMLLSCGYLTLMAPHAAAASSPAFPKRPPPVWTWSNQSTNIQAWIGQFEENRRFGWHHNLHIQVFGGGGQDQHNYHIYSNGQNAWRVFDNGVAAPPSPGNQRFYSGTSSSQASKIASDVANDVGDPTLQTGLQTKKPGDSDNLGSVLERLNQFSAWTPLDPNPAPGAAPDISPGAQLTGADCAGYFDFTAPRDPTRPTTLRINWGDGSHTVDELIPQGTGPYLISEVNGFPMAPQPPAINQWWVTATIVETGAVSGSAGVGHGDTFVFQGPGDFVGQFWTWGSRTGYDTSGALAVQTVGLQPYNDPHEAGTQTVNSTIAGAFVGRGTNCFVAGNAGCFKVYVAPNVGAPTGNGAALASGLYDINIINIGYSNHTTWLNPSGACGGSSGPSPTTRVGFVTVGAAGKIVLAYDANWNPLTVSGNIAGPFAVPNTYISNLQPQEAGVCISDDVANGGDTPLTMY